MDTTYYDAHANDEVDGRSNQAGSNAPERRSGGDRRQGIDRRKHERRTGEQARVPLTPQEIAALLNGSR